MARANFNWSLSHFSYDTSLVLNFSNARIIFAVIMTILPIFVCRLVEVIMTTHFCLFVSRFLLDLKFL